MLKKGQKIISFAAALIMMTSLFAGCGSTKQEGGASTTASSTPATSAVEETKAGNVAPVKLTFMDWESEAMNDKIRATMQQFVLENPGYSVDLMPAPLQDYGLKIQQMIAAKAAPDVFMGGNDMIISYGTDGFALDITKYTSQDTEFISKFYPGTVPTFQVNGKQVGLPGLLNCYGIFYNKKMFTEKNVPLPTNDWTYQDVFNAAEKLKDPAQKMFGIYGFSPDAFGTGVYSSSAGGPGFTDAIYPVTKVQVSDQFKECVNLFTKYIKDGAVQPPSFAVNNVTGMFMQGKVPMMMYGQWAADELIRNAPKELEWGYAPNPKVSKQTSILDAVGWCVSSSTKDPDGAYKLLKYIVSTTYSQVLPATPVAPAAYTDAAKPYYQKLRDTGHGDVADTLDYILNSPDKQPIRFLNAWAGDAYKFMNDWNNIIEGKAPVSKLDDIVKNVNDVIASAKK